MADIFLSYKKEDVEIAMRFAEALRKEGMSVWWDDSLTPQASWDATIEHEISVAGTVVVLWSPRSVPSDWVRREAHFGQDRGKLVPVIVEATEIPLAFTLNQTVNLAGWDGNQENRQWRKLLTWITDVISAKADVGLGQTSSAAPTNRFREAVGHMASGDPIVDGAFVNASTLAGTAFRDGDAMPVMRIVPKGSFLLGGTEEDPDHESYEVPQKRVDIPAPFAIGVFPVLASEYQKIVGSTAPASAPPPKASSAWNWFWKRKTDTVPAAAAAPAPADGGVPITRVSFDEAEAFVEKLSATTGESYRIPSEAEWEYACRAGTRTRYYFGDIIDSTMAAFGLTAGPVKPGSFPPNAFGLYDMHGNVREWAADLWHDSYDSTPTDGRPAMDGHASMRLVRGGGWSDSAALLRSSARMRATQSIRAGVVGFRVVRSLPG